MFLRVFLHSLFVYTLQSDTFYPSFWSSWQEFFGVIKKISLHTGSKRNKKMVFLKNTSKIEMNFLKLLVFRALQFSKILFYQEINCLNFRNSLKTFNSQFRSLQDDFLRKVKNITATWKKLRKLMPWTFCQKVEICTSLEYQFLFRTVQFNEPVSVTLAHFPRYLKYLKRWNYWNVFLTISLLFLYNSSAFVDNWNSEWRSTRS